MSNFNPRTVSAVSKLARKFGIQAEVYTSPGRPWLKIDHITMQRLDSGRWILAYWNQKAGQYESGDLTRQFCDNEPGNSFIAARALSGLESEVRLGNIRSYASATAALRSALD